MDVHFECPVCLATFSLPIYICEKGHNMCKPCSAIFPECAICGLNMTKNRNYPLEHIIKEQNYVLEVTIGTFTYDCPFFRECGGQNSTLHKLIHHLKVYHAYKVIECRRSDFVVTISRDELEASQIFIYRVFVYLGRLFKFCLQINHGENIFYFAVQLFGHDEEQGNFFYLDYQFPPRHNMYVGQVSSYSPKEVTAFVGSFVQIPKYFFRTTDDYINIYGVFKRALFRRYVL